jgi:hypothetical protein
MRNHTRPFRRQGGAAPHTLIVGPVDLQVDAPPSFDAAEAEVRRAIAALGAAGALSAEAAEVLDARIEAWCTQWVEGLRDQYTRTQDGAQRLIGEAQAAISGKEPLHLRALDQLEEAEQYVQLASARLGLPRYDTPVPAAPQLHLVADPAEPVADQAADQPADQAEDQVDDELEPEPAYEPDEDPDVDRDFGPAGGFHDNEEEDE